MSRTTVYWLLFALLGVAVAILGSVLLNDEGAASTARLLGGVIVGFGLVQSIISRP